VPVATSDSQDKAAKDHKPDRADRGGSVRFAEVRQGKTLAGQSLPPREKTEKIQSGPLSVRFLEAGR